MTNLTAYHATFDDSFSMHRFCRIAAVCAEVIYDYDQDACHFRCDVPMEQLVEAGYLKTLTKLPMYIYDMVKQAEERDEELAEELAELEDNN